MQDRIRLGISSCLLGQNVRYDGGHKLDRFLTDTLGAFVDYVPVCPEVEAGFPIPRESFRLVGSPDTPKFITGRSGVDYTEHMLQWSKKRVKELEKENLCGFIFKSNSPSSGMERVKVYNDQGMPVKKGVGLFAREFMRNFPLIPVEEDGRLHDTEIRENFIDRIFTLKRWRDKVAYRKDRGGLVDFHTRNKLLIKSHSPKHYREMGKLVAESKQLSLDVLYQRYESLLMQSIKLKSTAKKNTDVLEHMLGYFKKQLSADEKQEMLELIRAYRQGYVPLIVPLTMFKHYIRKYDQTYLKKQTYLNPHPIELKLRHHV